MKNTMAQLCLLFFISENSLAASRQPIPDVYSTHREHFSITHGNMRTLTQTLLARSGVTSLSDALYTLAGLQGHNTSGTSSSTSLSMRGFGDNATSNVLVLINGIPLTNPDLMPPDLNTIPIQDVRAVEITAGSENVLYGDQAVGGVVNILTDDTKEKSLNAQCSTGNYNLKECRIGFHHYWNDINYHVSFKKNETDNYRNHNNSSDSTLFFSSRYQSAQSQLSLIYKLTDEDMQYPGALTAAQVFTDRRQASNNTDFFKDKNQLLQVRHSYRLNDRYHLETHAFMRYMDGSGVLSSDFTQLRKSAYIRPAFRYAKNTFSMTTGADAQLDEYELNSVFGLTENRQKKSSLFSYLNYAPQSNLDLSAGIRLAIQSANLHTTNNTSTVNRAIASTLGASYKISKHTEIYLRRADNFRFPKAEENTPGKTPLRTQRGTSYETGISYEDNSNLLSLSLYQLLLKDEIAFDPLQTPENPFGSNRNLANTKRSGLSISGKTNLFSKLTLDGQLNYVDARFQHGSKSGKHIPLVSDVIARTGLSMKFNNYWSGYIEAVYTSTQYPANDDLNVTGELGGYTLYNLNVRYQYQQFSAALRINNISNKKYYLYSIYQPSMGTEFFYPAAERNLVLIVGYSLD